MENINNVLDLKKFAKTVLLKNDSEFDSMKKDLWGLKSKASAYGEYIVSEKENSAMLMFDRFCDKHFRNANIAIDHIRVFEGVRKLHDTNVAFIDGKPYVFVIFAIENNVEVLEPNMKTSTIISEPTLINAFVAADSIDHLALIEATYPSVSKLISGGKIEKTYTYANENVVAKLDSFNFPIINYTQTWTDLTGEELEKIREREIDIYSYPSLESTLFQYLKIEE